MAASITLPQPGTAFGALQKGAADLIVTDLGPESVQRDIRVRQTVPFHSSYHTGLVRCSQPCSCIHFRGEECLTGAGPQEQQAVLAFPFSGWARHSGIARSGAPAAKPRAVPATDPFTLSLYMTMLAMVIGTAAMLTVLEIIWPVETDMIGKNRMCDGVQDTREGCVAFLKSIYHTTAAVAG